LAKGLDSPETLNLAVGDVSASRDVHQAPAARKTIEAPDQRHRAAVALDQAAFGGIDPRGGGKPQRQDLASGDRAIVGNARKLADRQSPVVIEHRAFRAHAIERRAAASEVAQILRRLGMRLNRMRRVQQVAKLDQRRRGSPALLGRALENAVLVLKTQRADAARIVDRQQEVERVQRTALDIRAGASCFLASFGVVAQDDAARPAVRLRVRDRAVKDRSATLFAVKLRAGDQGREGWGRSRSRPWPPATPRRILDAARRFYAGRAFVRVTDKPPQTKWATGSNLAFVSYAADPERSLVIAMGVVDNLGKGAAGQAVQNANLICGLPETAGLDGVPVWP